jgi:hypothetical protein
MHFKTSQFFISGILCQSTTLAEKTVPWIPCWSKVYCRPSIQVLFFLSFFFFLSFLVYLQFTFYWLFYLFTCQMLLPFLVSPPHFTLYPILPPPASIRVLPQPTYLLPPLQSSISLCWGIEPPQDQGHPLLHMQLESWFPPYVLWLLG